MATPKRKTAGAAARPRGRQPKPPGEAYEARGTLRTTDEQWQVIRIAAKAKGLDPMTYARMRTLEAAQADIAAARGGRGQGEGGG